MKRNAPLQRKSRLESKSSLKRSPIQRKNVSNNTPKFAWDEEYIKLLQGTGKKLQAYNKALRDSIKERDGHHCQICGGPGEQIHHCVTRGRFYAPWYTIDSVHDPKNLMLVCHRCHQRIHDEPGFVDAVIEMQERRFGKLRKEFV